MNAAKLDKSERLQRVDALLSSGKQYSTLEIVQMACVCAVNSIIAELRANGRQITCKRFGDQWYYWMGADVCPYPMRGAQDKTASGCVSRGDCGCDEFYKHSGMEV